MNISEVSWRHPNIVLIDIESLRYDRLPCTGYHRNTTPHLCRFAQSATRYSHTYASASFTRFATTGIATGRYAFEVGVSGEYSQLSDNITTLAEQLRAAGYSTYGGKLPTQQVPGLERGYSETPDPRNFGDILSSHTSPVIIRWHYWPTHSPYTSAVERAMKDGYEPRFLKSTSVLSHFHQQTNIGTFAENKTLTNNLYDENLRAADYTFIHDTLQQLRASGEYNDTMIVITADHGELLGEHGTWAHGGTPRFEETVRVPLFIKYPHQSQGQQDPRLVSTIDLYPTVLDIANIPLPDSPITGISLISNNAHERVYVPSPPPSIITRTHKLVKCVNQQRRCGVRQSTANPYTLYEYDEQRVPHRIDNRTIGTHLLKQLELFLQNHRSEHTPPEEDSYETIRNRLEELGYID